MARVPYYINNALGQCLAACNYPTPQIIGGEYAFESWGAAQAAFVQVSNYLNGLYDDEIEGNEGLADQWLDVISGGGTLMYWSTNEHAWHYPGH